METKHIHEFVILAETCSFQETAIQTFTSQSSLTKHIQNIEKELGVPLFDRTTRKVKLNQYGAEFYKYAKQIDKISHDYNIVIRNMLREKNGKLNVGFQSRLGQYGIIQLLSDFQEKFPQFPLKLSENNQISKFLDNGECDFVFSSESTKLNDEIEEFICKTSNMAVVLPKNHPLAHESHITIEQIQNEKMIVHEDTPPNISWETQTLRRLFTEAGLEINEVMTVSFTSNLVTMVGQGMGIGMINRLQTSDNDNGRVVFVDFFPEIPFHIKLMYHKRIENEPAAASFIRFVKNQFQP